MKDFSFLRKKYLLDLYPNRGLVIVRGKGVFLEDEKGSKYLDLGSNYGVNILGYNHPFFMARINAQMKKLMNLHGSFISDIRARTAEVLVKRIGGSYKALFVNSGSEAVEVALKFVFYLTSRRKVLAFEGAFHGKTLGALSLTASSKYKGGLPKELFNFVERAKFNDVQDLRAKLGEEIAGVFIELVQGDGGIRVAAKGFVKQFIKLSKEKGALIVVDEVQTGVGRIGRFLAAEYYEGLEPDIILLGKGLAGGLPISAVLVKNELAKDLPKLFHSSTFGGNPLSCAGALAVLEFLSDEVLEEVERKGEYFINELKKIRSSLVVEVRGRGLMVGVEVKNYRNEILRSLQQKGIIALPAAENVIRFLPPYIISSSQLKRAADAISESLKLFSKNV